MNEMMSSFDAEHCLAGALLVDARCAEIITPNLLPEDFESESCRAVFLAVKDMVQNKKPIDPVTILQWTSDHGLSLSSQQVVEMMDLTPDCNHVDLYSRLVHEHKLRRVTREQLSDLSMEGTLPAAELLGRVQQMVNTMNTHVEKAEEEDLSLPAVMFPYEPPRWLIEPYFPRGKGTIVQAHPGVGKTAFMCGIAAAVSSGKSFLGLKVQTPGNVLLISTEDDPGVLSGRIEASGGDLTKVRFLRNPVGMTFNAPEIEQQLKKHKIRMVIFDPFQTFLGKNVDMNRANETRPQLDKIIRLCSSVDCACVFVCHLPKSTLGKPLGVQALGSVDIAGAMRSILHIVRNPDMKKELIAIHVKSSNAPAGKSIAYSIVDKGGVEWHDLLDFDEEDLERAGKRREQTVFSYEEEPLVKVLRRMLREKPDGGFWSYEALNRYSVEEVGYPCFQHAKNLHSILTQELHRQIQEKEGVMIRLGKHSSKARGILIQRLRAPELQQELVPGF